MSSTAVVQATAKRRKRRLFSVKAELVRKAREAALAAVQLYNNPQIRFKSELFIVTMHIAWTYLLHAYYRQTSVNYHYWERKDGKLRYLKTDGGARKTWELKKCLEVAECPIERNVCNNLKFLIGIRNEIEHQMTTRLDDAISAKFQACCLNFNLYIKEFFGEKHGIDRELALSLQFAAITDEQIEEMVQMDDLPNNVRTFIADFESMLTPEEHDSPQFAYRLHFSRKTTNHPGQADRVIEFSKPAAHDKQSGASAGVGPGVVTRELIKEIERPKFLAGQVVAKMKEEGYSWFGMHQHTELWRSLGAKDPAKGFGTLVAGKHWHWYETWLNNVREHCKTKDAKPKVQPRESQ
jgi:hypothetical protein